MADLLDEFDLDSLNLEIVMDQAYLSDRREEYDTFSGFEKLCYHIREYALYANKADYLRRKSISYPRKKKKQMRNDAAKALAELPKIEQKIESFMPDVCRTDRDEVMTFLTKFIMSRYSDFGVVGKFLKQIRIESGISHEELNKNIEVYIDDIERKEDKNESDMTNDFIVNGKDGKGYTIDEKGCLVIENGVTEIGGKAFYGCDSFTSVVIPNSVTKIDNDAFGECYSLRSVELPNSITTVGDGAFFLCENLTSIVIPNSVTEIECFAFCCCSSLQSFVIPSGVTKLRKHTFNSCSSLRSIEIPDSVTEIEEYVFCGCESLKSIVIPSGVTKIGEAAFLKCESLLSIEIPDGITEIGDYFFDQCVSLTSVEIPNGITRIGDRAFTKCLSLRLVEIPSSVKEIGAWAFAGCSVLTDIRYGGTKEQWKSVKRKHYWCVNIGTNIIHCSDGDINLEEYFIINGTVFEGCVFFKELTKLIIPDGVTEIGDYAFEGCSSLTSIVLPDSVTTIGKAAFILCESLKSIVIQSNITKIGESAFSVCKSLETIKIPNSVTEIEAHTFCCCESLKSVVLPSGVTKIGENAFDRCSSLTDICYEGTKEQWSKINFGEDWCWGIGAKIAHCSDGDVEIGGKK